MTVRLSCVIPTFNEALHLPALLGDLEQLPCTAEIIVCDGGSTDGTRELAEAAGARVLTETPGRARQMNAGADRAGGDWLCFLHADVRLDAAARADLGRAVSSQDIIAAVWRLAIDAPGRGYRMVEWGAARRDRWLGLPYGDQGLLVRAHVFGETGGFPQIPIMEDVAMVRALRRRYGLTRFDSRVVVSPRRWERRGVVRQTFINTALITAFLAGVSPHRLARWYPR